MATGSIGLIPEFSDGGSPDFSSDIPSSCGGQASDGDSSSPTFFEGGTSHRPAAAGRRRGRVAMQTSSPGADATVAAAAVVLAAGKSQESKGIADWPWEVAVGFVQLLGGLVVRGSTSNVRESALCGSRKGGAMSLAHLASFKEEPKGMSVFIFLSSF